MGQAPQTGFIGDLVFDRPAPLASNAEALRRLVSPEGQSKILDNLSRSGKVLRAQLIEVSQEHFIAYVPREEPAAGYGLLVFVPPWQEAKLPVGWQETLDRLGFIYVSAARSGNPENSFSRRIPLAVTAAQGMLGRYKINPDRVFIGGFSGGSRVALRIALAYPDLFRGAVLQSGSDPVGDAQMPLPDADLFHEFQNRTRLVFINGEQDRINIEAARETIRSLERWCVSDYRREVIPWRGHEIMDSASLQMGLADAMAPRQTDPDALAACNAGLEKRLTDQVLEMRRIAARGDQEALAAAVDSLDRDFSGLAATPIKEALHAQP